MNDIEKALVDIDFNINDCINKEVKVYDKYLDVKKKREEAENRVNRYGKNIEVLNGELDNLRINKMSLLTVPSIGFACFGFALLFNAPIALTVGVTVLGGAAGYKMAEDMVRFKMINRTDERLLNRLFPSIVSKKKEIKKVRNAQKNCMGKVSELTTEEESLKEEHEELIYGIDKLKEYRDSVLDLHIKKLRREYLPYHTDVEDVLNKVIKDPEYFYRTVCRELKNEEKRDIVLDMSGKSCDNCQNYSCRLTQEEKEKMSNCKAWYNEVEIGMSKVLRR